MIQKMKRIEPRVYSVLVHNFIYFLKSKSEYEKTLKSEFPPIPPLAIDLSSDEVEVHPKEIDSFFRTIEKDLLCELTDKELGRLLVEISSNRPEQRNTQPSFLHSILQKLTVKWMGKARNTTARMEKK